MVYLANKAAAFDRQPPQEMSTGAGGGMAEDVAKPADTAAGASGAPGYWLYCASGQQRGALGEQQRGSLLEQHTQHTAPSSYLPAPPVHGAS